MAYLHNFDPFALQFPEFLAGFGLAGVRWYGLAYLAGFVGGYYAILLKVRKGQSQLSEVQVADFVTYAAIGVLVGGRLGYALFYSTELWLSFDSHFPYWGVLKVNEGGMASHGGILGVLMVSWLYSRRHKMSFLHLQDVTVFGGAIGFFFGRLANFVNGELYGRESAADFRWAVKFPQEMFLWLQKDFGKLKAVGPAVDALQSVQTPTGPVEVNAKLWSTWLENYGPDPAARERVTEVIEGLIYQVQGGNSAVSDALKPVLTPRHPSQLYQAVLEGLLVFLALCWIWRKPQKPGVLSGWFATLYCSARIVGEQFRMPDAHIGFQLWGLTRGQWLSIGMLLVALAWLGYTYSRKVEKI
jgi:phosphatidylglycerol:prolipoprotein diacylglycerol transferase